MRQDHGFLVFKNKGLSRRMRGKVLVELIFVQDRQTIWRQDEMDKFYDVFKSAVLGIQRQATEAGVPLSFFASVGRLSYNGHLDPRELSGELIQRIHSQYLREQGLADTAEFTAARKRSCGADEVAIIFVMERHFRAFAMTGYELEYCVLTENNDAHAVAHELLHLFGAVDLYYPYHIYGLTMAYFPQTVMCTYEGMEVDPLTQYLIGWTPALSPKAREFVEKLHDFTVERRNHANKLEYYRDMEEYLVQQAAPFASLRALSQGAQEGDPWAEYLLGLCYRDGIGLEQDARKAEEYFARSGRTGLTIGAAAHAQMLLCRGLRTEQDRETLWLLLDYNACNHLKLNTLKLACLISGVGGIKDRARAVSLARHQHREPEQYQQLARRSAKLYCVAEAYSSRIPALQRAVAALRADYDSMMAGGDPDLLFLNAQILEEGVSVQRMPSGAFALYKKAAEGGNYRACQALSRCYREGIGTPRSFALARQWQERAAVCRDENPWDAFCRLV